MGHANVDVVSEQKGAARWYVRRAMTTLKSVLTRLEALDDDFMVFSAASTPPSATDLDALETELGVPLRADHRAIIGALGSGAIVVNESVWPRPVELEVRPSWQFCFGVEIFGIAPETAPAVDAVRQSSARKPVGVAPFVAAARRIGERGCVGYGANGELVSCEPGGSTEPAPASNLYDVLLGWLRTLEDDKERIKADAPRAGVRKSTKKSGIRGALDGKPASALAALARSLRDPDEKIVSEAAEALATCSDPSVIAPLAEALAVVQKNPRWVHGVAAGRIFTALGAAAAGAGPADLARAIALLTANLDPRDDRYAALPAFRALIALERKAEGAVPALERAAGGKDPYLATLARHALGAITGNYGPHRAALEAAAKSKEGAVRAVAESALRDAKMAEILTAK